MPNFSESLPEVLKRVHNAKSRNEKIEILKKADGPALQTILQGAFDPRIVWELPDGSPPYKKEVADYGNCPTVLEAELRKLLYFCRNPQMIQNKFRREKLFIDILEALHPSESELLIQMKDKKIKCNGLTQLLIHEIWPDLVPKPEEKEDKKKE